MTRINTNVSSLIAQNTLGRSNSSLQQALERLSTGLRINTGKDDPAGLIASENLRSDITAIRRAIGNTDRANQVIATADSALGQVSSLLNDIRGLITEAANTGAMSPDQIAANQLQIDASLAALNRIAQTTTFQGRKLLDGSLAFITEAGTGFGTVTDLKIDQANLGTAGEIAVNVTITDAATQAEITTDGFLETPIDATAATGTATVNVAQYEASGTLVLAGETIDLTATDDGIAAGAEGNEVDTIVLNFEEAEAGSSYDAETNTLTVNLVAAADTADIDDVIAAIDLGGDFDAELGGGGDGDVTVNAGHAGTAVFDLSGGQDAAAIVIDITAEDGEDGNVTLIFEEGDTGGDPIVVTDNEDGTFTILIDDDTEVSLQDILDAIEGIDVVATAAVDEAVDAENLVYNAGDDAELDGLEAELTGGADATVELSLDDDVVLEIAGATGAEVLSFGEGTTLDLIVSGINAVSDATGVEAALSEDETTLVLTSSAYGSAAFVSVSILSGDGNETLSDGLSATREEGSDIAASVNGIQASGRGNTLTVNTATLTMTMTVDEGSDADVSFDIVGGGALFQLGPNVVSNQQARIGVTSVNTARLGGTSGKLFELGSGGAADLTNDLTRAAQIVEESINQVTSLRGRLGAFQRTSLETNRNALNDTLVNLTDAESLIRDADFAAETAALTRAQILVQSGTVALQISNQNPQNVLALLR